jgi:hypothetical protein
VQFMVDYIQCELVAQLPTHFLHQSGGNDESAGSFKNGNFICFRAIPSMM